VMKMSRWLSSLPLRMRTLFKKRATEMELDEEIRFHVERQVDALVERGFSPETAREMAMKKMGNVERQMEQCREVRAAGGCSFWLATVNEAEGDDGGGGALAGAGDWKLRSGVPIGGRFVSAPYAGERSCEPVCGDLYAAAYGVSAWLF
jgi:hypothetical protein